MMIDNDMPKAMGFLQAYRQGMSDYSQSGEEIPDLHLQNKYAQELGGPLVEENLISGSPSFDITPDIDDPIVDRWIENSRQRNPNRRMPTYEEVLKRIPEIRARYGIKGV